MLLRCAQTRCFNCSKLVLFHFHPCMRYSLRVNSAGHSVEPVCSKKVLAISVLIIMDTYRIECISMLTSSQELANSIQINTSLQSRILAQEPILAPRRPPLAIHHGSRGGLCATTAPVVLPPLGETEREGSVYVTAYSLQPLPPL